MLTVEDLRWNLAVIARAAKICIFPLQLKTTLGGKTRMTCENGGWKVCIFLLWFSLMLAHSSYCIIRALFFSRGFDWTFVPMMVSMSSSWIICAASAYMVFIRERELNCVLFNEIIKLLEQVSAVAPAGGAAGRKSLSEMIVCFFAAPNYSVLIFYPILYALDREIPLLLISSVPAGWRNFLTNSVCLSIDTLMMGIYMTFGVYLFHMLITFVISFDQFKNQQLSRINSEESPLASRIVNGLKSLRIMELQLKLFNRVFAAFLYLAKMGLLLVTVACGFMVIRIHSQNPFITLIYTLGFVNVVIIYIGVFQTAFGVTSGVEELKNEIRLKTGRIAWRERRQECERVLRSVPKLGIKVGGFYEVEREAVLIYVDFCVKQIVNLLVTF